MSSCFIHPVVDMCTVFPYCRHVVTCDDRQVVLTTVMIFVTTGPFSCVGKFSNFENRTIFEGDTVRPGKSAPIGSQTILGE